MCEVGLVLQFFQDLDLLCEVLRVVVVEEVFVGGPAEPVGLGPELVWEVAVVVLERILLDVLVGVSGPASVREIAASVLVSGLHVLVVASVAWKVGRVCAELRTRAVAFEQVLRHWPLDFVSGLACESLEVSGVDIEVRSLQSAVFLVVVDDVGDLLLFDEALLVDGVFGEVWLDNVELAQVPAAVAIGADAAVLVVVEVAVCEFGGSFVEVVLLAEAVVVVVPAALRLRELRVVGSVEALYFGASVAPESQFGLEGWFLRAGLVSLREWSHGNSNNFICNALMAK